jgi:hypothetical protein
MAHTESLLLHLGWAIQELSTDSERLGSRTMAIKILSTPQVPSIRVGDKISMDAIVIITWSSPVGISPTSFALVLLLSTVPLAPLHTTHPHWQDRMVSIGHCLAQIPVPHLLRDCSCCCAFSNSCLHLLFLSCYTPSRRYVTNESVASSSTWTHLHLLFFSCCT